MKSRNRNVKILLKVFSGKRYFNRILSMLYVYLMKSLRGLRVDIDKMYIDNEKWVNIELSGADARISTKYLDKIIGIVKDISYLDSDIRRGYITGKHRNCLVVDLGLLNKGKYMIGILKEDSLKKTFKGNSRKIVNMLSKCKHVGLNFILDDVDHDKNIVNLSLSGETLALAKEWLDTRSRKILFSGLSKPKLLNILRNINIPKRDYRLLMFSPIEGEIVIFNERVAGRINYEIRKRAPGIIVEVF